MMNRIGAALALLTLVAGVPWALLLVGRYDWARLNLATAGDARLVLLLLTAIGWVAWAVWMLSVLAELVTLMTSGRRTLRLPGLAVPQAIAGALLTSLVSAAVVNSGSAVAPTPAGPSQPPVSVAASTVVAGDVTSADEARVAAQAWAAPAASAASIEHEVSLGDDLWTLAERYYGDGAQWRQITLANPALAADPTADLPLGSRLAITSPVRLVTVAPGESLSKLALRHLGDANRWPEIHALNSARIVDPDLIEVGWVLKVPLQATPSAGRATPPLTSPATTTSGPQADPARPASLVVNDDDTLSQGGGPTAGAPDQSAEAPLSTAPAEPAAPEPVGLAPSPRAPEVVALVGALGGLAAAAVLGGLALRRSWQNQSRPVGRRYVQPGAEAARFESALAVRATDDGPPDREVLLGRAMRHLARHWSETSRPAPPLAHAVVGQTDLQFVFAHDDVTAPVGFQVFGSSVLVAWSTLAELDDPDHPVAYPALVTLGEDDHRDLVMIDLTTAGVVGVRETVPGLADGVLSAMLVELTCAPWAGELGLLVVTDHPEFARAASERAVTTTRTSEGVAEVERLIRDRGRFLTDPNAYDTSRLDPDLAEAWAPQLVLFEASLAPDEVARVEDAVASSRCGVSVVLPVGDDTQHTTWEVTEAGGVRGLLRTRRATAGLPTPLAAQTIPTAAREAIAELYTLASDTHTVPAPWWPEPSDPEDAVNIIALHPLRATTGPLLRLLGPITLEGAVGEAPARAARQCLEYCAWLLQHPGSTATQMMQALLVAEGTRRSNMSRLRTWLGQDAAGRLYLPDAYSGLISLHEEVSSDWAQFLALTAGGMNRATTERLTDALELVRGAPLADAAPGQWHWAEGLRADMTATIRDAAVALARRAGQERNVPLVRWGVQRGLAVAPDDEVLLAELIGLELTVGQPDEAARLAAHVSRSANQRGVDLGADTIAVLQEALEGRRRAQHG